jgi:hypothetical protein
MVSALVCSLLHATHGHPTSGTRLSCVVLSVCVLMWQVRTDLRQGSLLEIETGPCAKSGAPATSSFSVGGKTGGLATSSFSVDAKSGAPATSTIPLSASSGINSIPITHRPSSAAQSAAGDASTPGCTDGSRSDSTAAKGVAAEQNETVGTRFGGEERLNNRLCSLSANGRAQKFDGKSRDQVCRLPCWMNTIVGSLLEVHWVPPAGTPAHEFVTIDT